MSQIVSKIEPISCNVILMRFHQEEEREYYNPGPEIKTTIKTIIIIIIINRSKTHSYLIMDIMKL